MPEGGKGFEISECLGGIPSREGEEYCSTMYSAIEIHIYLVYIIFGIVIMLCHPPADIVRHEP